MGDEDLIMDEKLELPQKHRLIQVKDQTETKKPRLTQLSDLTDEKQLMEIFGEVPPLRFELCRVRLIYKKILADLQLHGSIRASCFSPDPLLENDCLFNRKFNNPLRVHLMGYQALDDIHRCSLPISSTIPVVQIAAKLYITTDKVRDAETSVDIDAEDIDDGDGGDGVMDEATAAVFMNRCLSRLGKLSVDTSVIEATVEEPDKLSVDTSVIEATVEEPEKLSVDTSVIEATVEEPEPDKFINNEVFEVCDDYACLDFSNKPDGCSGEKVIEGKDGSLELNYVALKYAVDAHLEVEFVAPSNKAQRVYGSVVAYYGKNFEYSAPANEYHIKLFTKKRFTSALWPGNLNLVRSALAVPANSSVKIKAGFRDSISGKVILSGTCEVTVPLDGKPSVGSIVTKGYSLNVKVNWILPFEERKIPSLPMYPLALVSNSSVSCLAKRWKLGAHSTSSMTAPDELNRWSLREELENVFKASLERLFKPQEAVSCSISTCTKEDGGDYLCSGVMNIWPELRKARLYRGPKCAGLALKSIIMDSEYKDMIESCVVCGPGFVKFKLSRKWITECIYTMLTAGIDTRAPKLSVKKTVIYFLSQSSGEEMHMGHLRSTIIGESLARMLEYSGVVVSRKRITGELEDWDERHHRAWSRNSQIIGRRYQTVYQRLGVKVKEEDKNSYFIGDKAVPEGPDSPLVYLTALRHALEVEKADWILHVSDEGKRVSLEQCIIDARLAELIGKDLSECPLSHVGFGLTQGDDFEHPEVVNLVNVLDEAKSRCKSLLARQGMSDEEIEDAAEALGIDALKYADLKNNRLANYTFSYDQMFNEKGDTVVYLQFTHVRICSVIKGFSKDIKKLKAEELILKNDDERELGLHLLRFTEVLEEVCTLLTPHILCKYVYDLCVKFDSLEASVPQVVGSSEETSYSLLCRATDVVMRKCFDLLGITSICKT